MNMRIQNQTEANALNNVRSAGVRAAGPESAVGYQPSLAVGNDNVSLSNASNLVALAKTLTPADKQAKVAALTLQVRSGQYSAEASEVSRSVVQDHFTN